MADAAQDTSGGALGKTLIRVVGVALLCVAALLAGVVVALGPERAMAVLTGGTPDPAPAAEEPAAEAGGHGAAPEGDGHAAAPAEKIVVTPFKEIIVNISATTATGRQTTRFLKLNTALVYDSSKAGADHIEERKLYLRDSFQDYLRQLSERDVQGSAGLAILKAELLRRARTISDSQAPQEILISDLIVQ